MTALLALGLILIADVVLALLAIGRYRFDSDQ
jgi:hypothetical protein